MVKNESKQKTPVVIPKPRPSRLQPMLYGMHLYIYVYTSGSSYPNTSIKDSQAGDSNATNNNSQRKS